jgi:hypothetical protein
MLVLALLLAVAALFLSGGFALVHGTPDFYTSISFTPEQIDAASRSAEQTLTRMQNLAADAQSAQVRRAAGASTTQATTDSSDASTFSFSQDEINGLFLKWAELHGWRAQLDRLVTDPVIVLKPGRIILAGHSNLKQFDTILSLHFEPRFDAEGAFDLNLVAVKAGRLPLPQEAVIAPVRERAMATMQWRLPYWQGRAKMTSSGVMNQDAMYASLSKLLLRELNGSADEAILFMPVGHGFVPVRLSNLTVEEGSISLTFAPIEPHEQAQLIEKIRAPAELPPRTTN